MKPWQFKKCIFHIGKVMISGVVLASVLNIPVQAETAFSKTWQRSVTVLFDKGGMLASYAIKARDFQETNTLVRIGGRCESACTLYLAMPYSLLCLKKNASFGFHAPYGADRDANRAARRYMMERYPQWVRDWLEQNGGLKHEIKYMSHEYAVRFVRGCDESPVNWKMLTDYLDGFPAN